MYINPRSYSSELYHHQIKGAKHGVRRYQEEDGTWTEEGLRRRRERESLSSKEVKGLSKDVQTAFTSMENMQNKWYNISGNPERYKDDINKMTDEELRRYVNRVSLENQYTNLRAGREDYQQKQRKEVTAALLSTVGSTAVTAASVITVMKTMREMNIGSLFHSDELCHHGILGQKWGIRRFQYEDGSLTPEGKKRYYKNGYDSSGGLTKAGEKWQKKVEKQKQKENNKKNSWYNSLTDKQKKTFKTVMAAAGAITLTAAAMYVTPRVMDIVSRYGDSVVKAGSTVGHVGFSERGPLDKDMLYAAKGKDRIPYQGIWAHQKYNVAHPWYAYGRKIADVVDYDMTANKNLKIAGLHKGKKIFANYVKNLSADELKDLTAHLEETANKFHGYGQGKRAREAINLINRYKTSGNIKDLEKAYESFNSGLVFTSPDQSTYKTIAKFKQAVKDAGYSGVKDINDQKYSGYDTRSAKIFFDAKNDLSLKAQKAMELDEITKHEQKAWSQKANKNLIRNTIPSYLLPAGAGTGAIAYASAKQQSKMNAKKPLSKYQINTIKGYKRQGYSISRIAKMYGVSEDSIKYYLYGK